MGAPLRLSAGQRILMHENSGRVLEISDELTVSSSDSVFGFLEGSLESTGGNGGFDDMFDMEDDGSTFEENKSFWENQHNLLQATLCRTCTSSLERSIRNVTREAVKELQTQSNYCKCNKAVTGESCSNCLMREVSCRLRNAGFNAAVCRSKWRSCSDIPSGEHTFLDVIDESNSIKGEVRVIIELNFRAEFEMAKASDEYNQLINRLPEIFVAKIERLKPMIKIVCTAAKKCTKDKKIHMGPWRKLKFMQAKWFSSNCQRTVQVNVAPSSKRAYSEQTKNLAKASLLTMALLNAPRKAVVAT